MTCEVNLCTTSDLLAVLCTANHPHAHKRKCLVCHVETHPTWVLDSLNFISSSVFWEMVLPTHRGVASSTHGTARLADVSTRCCQGVLREQLNIQRPPCVAMKAVLTSASMIDLLVPFSHLVIALEITVRMAIKPGVPANNSPRLSPVLNSRATRRALATGCSSAPLFVNDPLDADHLPIFVPLHGFPCDNTIHLHPVESFHFLAFRFNHHLLTHMCLSVLWGQPFIPSPLQNSSSSAAFTPCRPAISAEIRARVPGYSSSSFTILSPCARFTPLP